MAGDRDAFLSRVRDAVVRGRSFPVRTLGEFPAGVGYVGGGTDLVARFAAEFQAVGGQVHRAASHDDARAILRRILSKTRATPDAAHESVAGKAPGPAYGLLWEHPLLARLGVNRLLEDAGFTVLRWDELNEDEGGLNKERLFAAAVGISSVEWAIAETGTLAVAGRPGQPRSVSLLPPVHLAVVEPRQILPDLFDLFEELNSSGDGQVADGSELPSNLVLITGPSKTGDIELKLTTGVHGPGQVHVVISE